jgi:hypothetical protein
MNMADARVLDILKQVEGGDLTPEEADQILGGLGVTTTGEEPDAELDGHPHHAQPPMRSWSALRDRGVNRADRTRARLDRQRARLERRLRHEHDRRERLHRRLGDSYTVDHLIRLRLHGISQDYIEDMREAGFENLTPDELVELRIHGVSPDYAADIREQLGDVPVDQMIEFKIHGVTPDLVEELRESGIQDPTPDDVLRWRHTTKGSRFGEAVNQAVEVVGPHVQQLVETALAEARQRIYDALRVSPAAPEEWGRVDTRPGLPAPAAKVDPPAAPPSKPAAPGKKKDA